VREVPDRLTLGTPRPPVRQGRPVDPQLW